MLKQPCYTQFYASGRSIPIFHAVCHHSYLLHDSLSKKKTTKKNKKTPNKLLVSLPLFSSCTCLLLRFLIRSLLLRVFPRLQISFIKHQQWTVTEHREKLISHHWMMDNSFIVMYHGFLISQFSMGHWLGGFKAVLALLTKMQDHKTPRSYTF